MPEIDRLMGLVGNVAIKAPCRVATTASLGINMSGLSVIDGIQTVQGDRVLRKNDADQTLNGIWVADSGFWTRATDFDGLLDVVQGTLTYVISGTLNGNMFFQVTSAGSPTPGTDPITWTNVTMTLAGISVYMQSLLPAVDAAAARATLGAVIGADVQAYDATIAKTGVSNAWSKGQRGTPAALADAANVVIDMATANNFTVTLSTANGASRVLANPSTATAAVPIGQSGLIALTHSTAGSSSGEYTFGSNYTFGSTAGITGSTGVSALDLISYYVVSATNIFVSKAASTR